MTAPKNPVDAQHSAAFMRYARKWQRLLNMLDWRFQKSDKLASKTAMAEVKCHLKDRLAMFYIGTDFGSVPVTPESLERIALHESLHAFLHELVEAAKANASQEEIMSAEHRVINVLEKLLMKLGD